MDIEHKSDELDKRMANLPNLAKKTMQLISVQILVMTVTMIAFFTLHFYESSKLEHQIHDVVIVQVPALKSQISQRDKTISDQHYELDQAIAAIKKLAAQVISLGGDPGQITISPPNK